MLTEKLSLINNNIHTKPYANRKDRQSLLYLYFATSGQEMEQVYSYNPEAHMGTGAAESRMF